MSAIHISVRGDAHEYTRSRTPWLLGANREAKGETTTGKKFGWKLFHYISGGGMKSFGRTVQQEEADAKRARFLAASAAIGAVWLFYWIA
ncbi:MAG: hypothetical protein J6U17_02740 [Kiritimatiellae bacterium]|nr:hypothetical protein [Kiritimatiellia bacterium]